MTEQNIARRYGQALFQIAKEDARYEDYYDQLKSFSDLLGLYGNLKGLLVNPVFSPAARRAVLEDVLSRLGITDKAASFILLLSDQKRIDVLDAVVEAYRSFVDEAMGRVRVSARVARGLSPELTAKLAASLKKMTGREVEMNIQEDPSLLGGVWVRIGDTIYDGTLKKQLSILEAELMAGG
ncbi:MAG: ATP synthase F1 subunit delta [Smithellaceae bacterium]|nr:ATP synthase F1 subunit delta [Smithellaceae bacterium]